MGSISEPILVSTNGISVKPCILLSAVALFSTTKISTMERIWPTQSTARTDEARTNAIYTWLFQTYEKDGKKQYITTEYGAYVPNYGVHDIAQIIGKFVLKRFAYEQPPELDTIIKSRLLSSSLVNTSKLADYFLGITLELERLMSYFSIPIINKYLNESFLLEEAPCKFKDKDFSPYILISTSQHLTRDGFGIEETSPIFRTFVGVKLYCGNNNSTFYAPFYLFDSKNVKRPELKDKEKNQIIAAALMVCIYLDKKIHPYHINLITRIFKWYDQYNPFLWPEPPLFDSSFFIFGDKNMKRHYQRVKKYPLTEYESERLFDTLPQPIKNGLGSFVEYHKIDISKQEQIARALPRELYKNQKAKKKMVAVEKSPTRWLSNKILFGAMVSVMAGIWYYNHQA